MKFVKNILQINHKNLLKILIVLLAANLNLFSTMTKTENKSKLKRSQIKSIYKTAKAQLGSPSKSKIKNKLKL